MPNDDNYKLPLINMEFTLKTKIKATAEEIYTAWLNSEGHTKMTGGKATASDKIGDSFTT